MLTGKESPADMLVLSYGMEEGLRLFYKKIKTSVDDVETEKLLAKLAGIEETHKRKLLDLYILHDPAIKDKEQFEKNIVSKYMEGGFTTDEFIEKNRIAVQSVLGVLDIAMMLEAQAFDLYIRYSRKADNAHAKKILYQIAEEEKMHLKALGGLIDEKFRAKIFNNSGETKDV